MIISPAYAQAAQGGGDAGLVGFLPIVLMFVLLYFLMIRPQMKRQKEHKAMLEKIKRGDEVLTNGGIAGKVTDIGDHFITVEVADNVRIRVQKGAVCSVLPTGTLDSAK